MDNYQSMIGWGLVALAIAAEMVGIFGLSLYSRGKTIANTILYFGGLAASFVALYFSFQYLPVSIAYTVLTGVGTAAAVAINIMFFNESKDIKRLISLALIIAGVCGLKLLYTEDDTSAQNAIQQEHTVNVSKSHVLAGKSDV